MNTIPLPLAKSGPTEDILRQCGHRAKALFKVLNCKRQHFNRNMCINETITLISFSASLMTHQECVMAMGTAYPAHAWHGQNWRCNRTRSQIDNTFAIWPGACDTLRRTLAYEQTITWTSYVLFSRWSVSYGLCEQGRQERLV